MYSVAKLSREGIPAAFIVGRDGKIAWQVMWHPLNTTLNIKRFAWCARAGGFSKGSGFGV